MIGPKKEKKHGKEGGGVAAAVTRHIPKSSYVLSDPEHAKRTCIPSLTPGQQQEGEPGRLLR